MVNIIIVFLISFVHISILIEFLDKVALKAFDFDKRINYSDFALNIYNIVLSVATSAKTNS